jgi:hypothetical protein
MMTLKVYVGRLIDLPLVKLAELVRMGCVRHWPLTMVNWTGGMRQLKLTLVLVNVKESTTSRALPAWQGCLVSLVRLANLLLRRMKSGAVHLIHLFHLNTEIHESGSSVSPYHGSVLGSVLLFLKASMKI